MADVSNLRANINGVFETFGVKDKIARENTENLSNALSAAQIVNSASGAIASFSDGAAMPMKSLTVEMDPIQDLHGYDSPWPAGGGKNKIIPLDRTATNNGVSVTCSSIAETITLSGTATNSGGRYITLTATVTLPAGDYVVSVTGDHQATYIVQNASTNVYLSTGTFTLSEETSVYIGANVSRGTEYNETVKVQIESGSTATAWTPYSNICPISGRDEVSVVRTGVNLFDFPDGAIVRPYRIIPFPVGAKQKVYMSLHDKDTSIDMSGISIGFVTTSFIETSLLKNDQYRWVFTNNVIRPNRSNTSGGISTVDGDYLLDGVLIYPPTEGTLQKIRQRFDIQITVGSTASSYEPYNGQSITVQLGDTVYGGTLDVITGKATIAWKKYIGSAFANASAQTGGYYARMRLGGENYAGGQIAPARYACNAAVKSQNQYDKWYYNAAGTVGSTVNYVNMYIPADAIDYHEGDNITALLNAAYNASDFEFILPIPEPFDIDITPASLSTLKGDNNVWSDADSVTVDYVADPKLYIDKKIAEVLSP